MDEYTLVIIGSALGFFALAALLLIPVYRFLIREERASEELDPILKAELRRRRLKRANIDPTPDDEAHGGGSRHRLSGNDDSGNDDPPDTDEDDGGVPVPSG